MDGMYVRGVGFMIKQLFLEDCLLLCYSNSFFTFLHYFSDPYLMDGLSHYIESSKPFPLYTCSSSNPALKYMSYRAFSLALCERQWLKILFRSLLHINAAKKAAAMHLMRWWHRLFWDLPSHLLLLECIPINKQGLRPNIRVQAFAPTMS